MEVTQYQFGNVTGEETYDNMIRKVCDTVASTQNQVLDMYWTIGDTLYQFVMTQEKKNVSAALTQISQHIREASNDRLNELGPDSLRKALKIRESFDANALDLAKAGCVSLRNLIPMCQNDVTDEEREQYLKEVVEGEIDQTEIPERVKEDHPAELKEEKRGGGRKKKEAPLGFVQRVIKDIDKLLTDFEEDYPMQMSTVLASEDDTAKEEFERHYETLVNQVELLNRLWDVDKLATKTYLGQ